MSRRRPLALLFALLVFTPLVWLGCESGIDRPPETTPETRAATALLPADARMTAMVDVQHLQKNGPERARKMMNLPFARDASAGSARLRDFLDASGLNPDRDLEQIYIAVPNRGEDVPQFVAYGSFDHTRIEDALRSKFGDDLEPSTYRGVDVFVATETDHEGRRFALAVPNNDMMLAAADRSQLEAMIDRLHDGDETAEPVPLVRKASQGQSFWFATHEIDHDDRHEHKGKNSGAPEDFRMLERALKDVAGHFSFASNGDLDGRVILVPKSSAQASDVADVARGAIAALKQHSDASESFVQAAQQARVETAGDEVHVSFTLPADLINSLSAKR